MLLKYKFEKSLLVDLHSNAILAVSFVNTCKTPIHIFP